MGLDDLAQLLLLRQLHLIELVDDLTVDDRLQHLEPIQPGQEAGAYILFQKLCQLRASPIRGKSNLDTPLYNLLLCKC